MAKYPDTFKFSVSYTTRSPRAGETPGESYHYITREEFQAMIDRGEFIEHAEFSGNIYGTPFTALEAGDRRVILDLEMNGVKALKTSGRDCLYIFIAPPSLDSLKARLTARGSESESSLAARLAAASSAMDYSSETPCPYDYVIVNGEDVDKAAAELEAAVFGLGKSDAGGPSAASAVTSTTTPAPTPSEPNPAESRTAQADAADAPAKPAPTAVAAAAAVTGSVTDALAAPAAATSTTTTPAGGPAGKKSKTCSIL
ncbi:P-loop containing nucleoside triphosphate hydrolase protein [Powellomyces hirtus]|nr:P-loop containing nucleoside triphosphate hydrolase protein [Powellomyces hirtus]